MDEAEELDRIGELVAHYDKISDLIELAGEDLAHGRLGLCHDRLQRAVAELEGGSSPSPMALVAVA